MAKIITVPLEDLLFDPNNPRLIGEFDGDQDKMFRFLVTDIGVDDLLESLATSGLFDADPIIVRPAPAQGKYFVVEGNRRLAALKLLTGEAPQDKEVNPNIPKFSLEVGETFKHIKVQTDWSPEELRAYLGYKHVTASREWSPDSKAKFVYENAKGDLSPDNLRLYARSLGTKYPTLLRWLTAYLVLKQAMSNGFFEPREAPSKGYFGTFYTLLGGKEAQTFLKLGSDLTQNLVPEDHLPQLSEFIQWTVGTKTRSAYVNSRQQKAFEQVLSSPSALKHFRARGDITSSLLYTEFNAEQIADRLQKATYMVDECLSKLYDVREDERVAKSFAEFEGSYRKARLFMFAAELKDK
jgi:hypothetical protein